MNALAQQLQLHRGVILLHLENERSSLKNPGDITSSPNVPGSPFKRIRGGYRKAGSFYTKIRKKGQREKNQGGRGRI